MTRQKSGFEALMKSALFPQEQLVRMQNKNYSCRIGLPKEVSLQENRIALTPEAVGLLVNNGHEVWVEEKAGQGAKFSDRQYSEAGATIINSNGQVYQANIVLKIEPPTFEEISFMKPGQTLISALQPGHIDRKCIKELLKKRVTALAYEFIEDKVGGVPIVRVLSEIAGSVVVLIAAEYLSSTNRGKGVIFGGITAVPPTKVVIIGAGTVAEYCARTALSMGAEIQVFDNHIYKLRRIRHILGRQFYTSTIDTVALGESLKDADVVIGALRAEHNRARHVVSEEMVSQMKPDSLIIDLTIDQGGCIATSEMTTHADPVFKKYGVIHYCVPNVASRVACTAASALSNIFTPLLLQIAEEGGIDAMLLSHAGFLRGVYAYKGSLTHESLARELGLNYKNIDLLMAAARVYKSGTP